MGTLANSENPDEMQHNIFLDKIDLKRKTYNMFWKV